MSKWKFLLQLFASCFMPVGSPSVTHQHCLVRNVPQKVTNQYSPAEKEVRWKGVGDEQRLWWIGQIRKQFTDNSYNGQWGDINSSTTAVTFKKKYYQIIGNRETVEWFSVCKVCPKVSTSRFDNASMLPQVIKPAKELLHEVPLSILAWPNPIQSCYPDHGQNLWKWLAAFTAVTLKMEQES